MWFIAGVIADQFPDIEIINHCRPYSAGFVLDGAGLILLPFTATIVEQCVGSCSAN